MGTATEGIAPDQPPVRRLDSLTGARFVAAFSVFCFHLATLGLLAPGTTVATVVTTMTKSAGTIGVSFFFLLSGFVLTWSVRPDGDLTGFVRRRLVKILPNHVVTFAAAMILFAAASTPPVLALVNLLLLQAWVPDPAVFLSVNGPSWSLSCELLFYLMFPLLFAGIRRIRDERLWWWAGGTVGLIAALPVLGSLLLPGDPRFGAGLDGTVLAGESIYRLWFVYVFPPARLLDFALGMLVARIVLAGRSPRWAPAPAVALVAFGYGAGVMVPLAFTVDAVTVVPLALFIAALAEADTRGAATLLSRAPMRWLGDRSFAFYLVHELVLAVLVTLLGSDGPPGGVAVGLVVVGGLALSILVAALVHCWIEMPAVHRWSRPGGRVPPVPDPPVSGTSPVPDPKAAIP